MTPDQSTTDPETRISLTKAEIWELIGAVDGIWSEERGPELQSAQDKLAKAWMNLSRKGA